LSGARELLDSENRDGARKGSGERFRRKHQLLGLDARFSDVDAPLRRLEALLPPTVKRS